MSYLSQTIRMKVELILIVCDEMFFDGKVLLERESETASASMRIGHFQLVPTALKIEQRVLGVS